MAGNNVKNQKKWDSLEGFFSNTMNGQLGRAVFSAPRKKSLEYKKVQIHPVILKGMLAFQVEYVFEKKVTHENIDEFAIAGKCIELVETDFKQVNIFNADSEIQILAAKAENPRITVKEVATTKKGKDSGNEKNASTGIDGKAPRTASAQNSADSSRTGNAPLKVKNVGSACILEPSSTAKWPSNLSHNRSKNYIIPDGVPCDFLVELGVMGKDGKVFPKGYNKFRQINRYLEIVNDALNDLGGIEKVFGEENKSKPFRVIDFGCGKAYLTFALYYYLKVMNGYRVEIIGLDLKKDVIEFCEKTAKKLGYDGLSFQYGDIADYESDGADMVVTLHACDTATDYALANAVRWHSRIILSVPCCQHELFKQIKNEVTKPMFKHGILKERFTEILTDGVRGLKLEAKGYKVAMIEFTSLEHTARNIMIKAIMKDPKCQGKRCKEAQAEYDAICTEYSIDPTAKII